MRVLIRDNMIVGVKVMRMAERKRELREKKQGIIEGLRIVMLKRRKINVKMKTDKGMKEKTLLEKEKDKKQDQHWYLRLIKIIPNKTHKIAATHN